MAKTTIEFGDRAADELANMAREMETSKAEVIRDALSLYAFIFRELSGKEDSSLAIVQKDEIKKLIVVPGVRVPVSGTSR